VYLGIPDRLRFAGEPSTLTLTIGNPEFSNYLNQPYTPIFADLPNWAFCEIAFHLLVARSVALLLPTGTIQKL
jgi:hypothetical protein